MKRTFTIPALATGLLLVFGLTNCKKEQNAAPSDFTRTDLSRTEAYASLNAVSTDRIDAIVKDLASTSYSLSFGKSNAEAGISRTSYGAESSYQLADPQDLICPDLFRKFNKWVPLPKWPTVVWPTCPTMVPWENVAISLQDYLAKADPAQFKGLQGIKTYSGEIVLGNQVFKRKFATYQADKLDEVLSGIDPSKFVLLNDPRGSNGILTRDTYGYADLNRNVFIPYNKSLKHIIVFPKVIGCFDPEIMKVIRERIQQISPALTKRLGVTPMADTRNVAILSF